jgi:DNA mismatch repair protein MutL
MMAYEDLIPKEAFPFYALFLDIDPARIDVNVHPTKQEIKFDDEKLVYNYLKVAVRHALGQYSLTPTLDFEQETSLMPERQSKVEKPSAKVGDFTTFTSKANANNEDSNANSINYTNPTKLQGNNLRNWQKLYDGLDDIFDSDKNTQSAGNQFDNNQSDDDNSQEVFHSKVDNSDDETTTIESSMWGQSKELDDAQGTFSSQQKEPYQIHSTYIVSQIKSGFMLIDQQSAHERILYEKYLALFDENRVATQAELFPKTVTVSPTDAILLMDILPEINQLGFDVQAFGQNTFVLHGIPSDMKGVFNEKEIVETLLEQYKQNTDLSLSIKENVARSMAKSAAIKRGKTLNVREMRELIDRLFACTMPYQSPSGQNCFILYSLEDLVRQFAMG